MKSVRPISTPWKLKLREIRFQFVPVFVFVLVAAVVAWIWGRHVTPPLLVGQVEPVIVDVVTTDSGTLGKLTVGLFEPVHAGQEVATVIKADPRLIEANLAVIRAELNLAKAQLQDRMVQSQRAYIDLERLRLELLQERTALAVAKVRLQYAEVELSRLEELRKTKPEVISESAYDLAKTERDAILEEVSRREQTVRELDEALAKLSAETNGLGRLRDAFAEHLQAILNLQEERLRLAEEELSPEGLVAPLDGIVIAIHRRSGQNVVAGEPIITIGATNASRIIAYALPPFTDEIRVGAQVEVVRRSARRESGIGRVLFVAPIMEPVPALLYNPLNARSLGLGNRPIDLGGQGVEVGVPVVISLPPELPLRPGELVDLRYINSSWHRALHASRSLIGR